MAKRIAVIKGVNASAHHVIVASGKACLRLRVVDSHASNRAMVHACRRAHVRSNACANERKRKEEQGAHGASVRGDESML
jgi:hypothetical protein